MKNRQTRIKQKITKKIKKQKEIVLNLHRAAS